MANELDLSDALIDLSTGTYTVHRRPPAQVVMGRAVPQPEELLQVEANVYPTNGRELQRLPEGMRTQEVRTMLSPVELKGQGAGQLPDLVDMDGDSWEVQNVKRWQLGGFWEVLLTKVGR